MQISQTDVDKFKKIFVFRMYSDDSLYWLTSLNYKTNAYIKAKEISLEKCFFYKYQFINFSINEFFENLLGLCFSVQVCIALILSCFSFLFSNYIYLFIDFIEMRNVFFFSHFFFSLSFVMKQQYMYDLDFISWSTILYFNIVRNECLNVKDTSHINRIYNRVKMKTIIIIVTRIPNSLVIILYLSIHTQSMKINDFQKCIYQMNNWRLVFICASNGFRTYLDRLRNSM